MAGYLDSYGVVDQRREKIVKRAVIASAGIAVAAVLLFLFLRTFREERTAHSFLNAVRDHDYATAYRVWGCAPTCKDYPLNKFMEDWGPSGVYKAAPGGKFTIVDVCGAGVVLTLEIPKTDPVGIWVDRNDRTLSFAPWPRCPGRHLHLWEFIKSKF